MHKDYIKNGLDLNYYRDDKRPEEFMPRRFYYDINQNLLNTKTGM